jgi:hypothetical protein
LYRRVPACRDARYVDVVDLLGPEEFLAFERERLADDPRRKNQKTASDFESTIVEQAGAAGGVHIRPAHLFGLLRRHGIERVLAFPWEAEPSEREDLVVVKFWFGGQLPADDRNLDFIRQHLSELKSAGPVIAIDNPFTLELNPGVDDPFRAACRDVGVPTMSPSSYRTNIAEQVDLLSRARRFVGTYGGFSYLGLYTGTEMETYYSSPKIVFTSHFVTLGHALAALNGSKRAGEPAQFSLIHV